LQIWGVVVGVVRKYSNASTRYDRGAKQWARIVKTHLHSLR
jgi:hypothetical protein